MSGNLFKVMAACMLASGLGACSELSQAGFQSSIADAHSQADETVASADNDAVIGKIKSTQKGKASYYYEGRTTASGAPFRPNTEMTAAHRTLPFGTLVRVTNLDNHKSAVVKINDRGPFVAGRIIDVSKRAAASLGMLTSGTANVLVEVASR